MGTKAAPPVPNATVQTRLNAMTTGTHTGLMAGTAAPPSSGVTRLGPGRAKTVIARAPRAHTGAGATQRVTLLKGGAIIALTKGGEASPHRRADPTPTVCLVALIR